jgi:ribosomal protein S27E
VQEQREDGVKINCLSCGHKVDIGDTYDDFEGEVKCYVCGGILHIRTAEGQVRSVKLGRAQEYASASAGEAKVEMRAL